MIRRTAQREQIQALKPSSTLSSLQPYTLYRPTPETLPHLTWTRQKKMASGTGRQYNDPYGDHQYGSGSNTPVPVYTTGYNDAPYQPYDDKDGGYRGGGAVQYGRGYGGQQEELMKDQYPLHHGDMGERLHPNQADQYGYDNPYTRSGASDGGHGTVASSLGPWDSASQRSIASSSVPSQQQPQHLRNKPSYAGGLSYIDEEGAYYRSNTQRPASEIEMRGLVNDPSPMAGRHQLDGRDQDDVEFRGIKGNDYDTSPMAYPPNQTPMYKQPSGVQSWLLFPTGLDRVLAIFGVKMGKLPLEQEIERKRRGIPGQRFPVAVWTLTISEPPNMSRFRSIPSQPSMADIQSWHA